MKKRTILVAMLFSITLLGACSKPFTATEENMNNPQDQQEMDNLMEDEKNAEQKEDEVNNKY